MLADPLAAKSKADFISKLGKVEEEADESGSWLEMLRDISQLELRSANFGLVRRSTSTPWTLPSATCEVRWANRGQFGCFWQVTLNAPLSMNEREFEK